MSFGASQFSSVLSSIEKMISGPEIQNMVSESLAQIKPFFTSLNSRINAVNVYETADNIVVEIQVPGIDKNHLKLWVEGQNLMVSCEQAFGNKTDQTHYHRMEFENENYTKMILLPVNTDTSNARANISHGILTVKFEKLSNLDKIEIVIE